MALNFPDSPTNNQIYTDATTGEQWKYEQATNSWTSLGLTTSTGIQYKGGLDITAAPPAGVSSGQQYSVTATGTANAGFGPGIVGTVSKGSVVMYTGSGWIETSHAVPDATAVVKGIDTQKWTRTGTVVSPTTAGDDVFTTGAVKVGGTSAAPNIQVKADGSIVANTNGLVYEAATKRLGVGTNSITGFSDYTTVQLGSSTSGSALRLVASGDTPGTDDFVIYKNSAGSYLRSYGDPLVFHGSNSEYGRFDSSGRLLVGASSTSSVTRAVIQGNSTGNSQAITYFQRGSANPAGSDQLAEIKFADSNGSVGAEIAAYSDDAWATNDYPGRLVFSTCPSGSASPVEAMRIKNSKIINFANAPVYADNTAAKAGGLVDGDIYRTATGQLMIVYT